MPYIHGLPLIRTRRKNINRFRPFSFFFKIIPEERILDILHEICRQPFTELACSKSLIFRLMPSAMRPRSIHEVKICFRRIFMYQLICIQCSIAIVGIKLTSDNKDSRTDVLEMWFKRTFLPKVVIIRVQKNFIPECQGIRKSSGQGRRSLHFQKPFISILTYR